MEGVSKSKVSHGLIFVVAVGEFAGSITLFCLFLSMFAVLHDKKAEENTQEIFYFHMCVC